MTINSTDEENLREDITMFLRRNFPQIKMHGGTFSIDSVDTDEGIIVITLSGACSGCGISPMTIQALKTRMVDNIPEVNEVHARTGQDENIGTTPSFPERSSDTDSGADDDDLSPEAPF